VADADLEKTLRAVLTSDDDYIRAGKPVYDCDDAAAREAVVDALARDAMALLGALDGRPLTAQCTISPTGHHHDQGTAAADSLLAAARDRLPSGCKRPGFR
jgi:hypothetical protein